jgi:uncharacterized protein YdaU (DUF1376 family)
MAALPYIQLYVADYLADTAHLNAREHGAYILLIMNYWQTGKPLNNSNERLTNVARMSKEEWNESKITLQEFFKVDGDTWTHLRIESDLFDVNSKSIKASDAGKKSAEARRVAKLNEISTDVKQTLNHTDTDTDTDTDTFKSKDIAAPEVQTKKRKTKTSLPEVLIPTQEHINFAELNKLSLTDEMKNFRFHHEEKLTMSGSWNSSFSKWLSNAVKFRKPAGNGFAGVQDARLEIARQIMGESNGNDRSFIDITTAGSIESDREGIPKIANGIREPTIIEMAGD